MLWDLGRFFPKWSNTTTFRSTSWVNLQGCQDSEIRSLSTSGLWILHNCIFHYRMWPHRSMFSLASSMLLLISAVILNCSFWGTGKGTVRDCVISGFLLLAKKSRNTKGNRLITVNRKEISHHFNQEPCWTLWDSIEPKLSCDPLTCIPQHGQLKPL